MKNDSEENKTTETAVTRLDELERQQGWSAVLLYCCAARVMVLTY